MACRAECVSACVRHRVACGVPTPPSAERSSAKSTQQKMIANAGGDFLFKERNLSNSN